MFCSECGAEAAGKFCWSCGKPLVCGKETAAVIELTPNKPAVNWQELVDVQQLLAVPDVRERIAQYAARAKKKFSGEDFIECCDKYLSPVTGGVPFSLIAKVTQPISEKLGLKTGKERSERVAGRPGEVIVALLCWLAENGHQLREMKQIANGCTLVSAVPSDIWSLKGDLSLTVRVEGTSAVVEAALTIPGQVYDWGKSNRILDRLFGDLKQMGRAA